MVRDIGILHIGSLPIVQLAYSGIVQAGNARDKGLQCCDDDPLTRSLARKPESEQKPVPRNRTTQYVDELQFRDLTLKGDLLSLVVRSKVDCLLTRF